MDLNRAGRQTRTANTVQSYLKRAENLLARIADELDLPEDAFPPPAEAVAFMRRNASQWKWSTFRQYQASLVCRYETEAERTGNQLFLETAEEIRSLAHSDCKPASAVGQTSSRKRKGIRLADYDLLIPNLSSPVRGGEFSKRTALWLMAAVATGLRPREWEHAELDEAQGMLHARNAKATNGRGTGVVRSVPVATEDVTVVRAHLQSIRELKEKGYSWLQIHAHCSVALNRACKSLWGNDPTKRYALYSARHQFSANSKAIHTPEEVAALLGHASVRTARTHYAPRRSAWPKFRDYAKHKHEQTKKPSNS